MSDHHVVVIPSEPNLIPAPEQITALKTLLWQWMPDAEEIIEDVSDSIQFRDCGENFEYVACPACEQHLTIEQWHLLMDQDYDLQHGFQLKPCSMPCCSATTTVNRLVYAFQQGFSRFMLTAVNARQNGFITEQQKSDLQQILGCEPVIIYRHI